MKIFKNAILSMAVATALLAGHAATNDARAVTFLPNPAVIDFGNVAIGSTKALSFDVSWMLDGGEAGSLFSLVNNTAGNGFSAARTNFGCQTESVACTYDAEFTPTAAGPIVFNLSQFLTISLSLPTDRVVFMPLQFIGTGIAATVVPLPAAFPLFGTGLGLLGFIGWRRRRKAAAV